MSLNAVEILTQQGRRSFSLSETASILNVPQVTLERAIKSSSGVQICEGLPVTKPNGRWRVDPVDLRRLLGCPLKGGLR